MSSSQFRRLNPFRKGRKDLANESSKSREPAEAFAQGLKIVADGDQPVVDIVAVHGLNGHRDNTWTTTDGIHWLRDLLPTDIPQARIFCWGYDANTHGERISCQYLYDHARTLVSDLCLKRKLTNATRRPIIFIAHSIGGIIVKSALIHSNAARKNALEEHRSIKSSTYSIIFMGTPHQGGNGVQLGKLLVNIASVLVPADDHLLKHLERDSEWLQQQLGQYGPISSDFVTKFAYEEYQTPTALGHSMMIVPRASAVVPGASDAESIAIHADHIKMVRFASKENNDYITMSGHLQIMAQDASDIIASRWEEEDKIDDVLTNPDNFSITFSLSDAFETSHFVARKQELTEMHKNLTGDQGRQTVILHGLSGIGKTQLAIAYTKAYRVDYSAIFWLNIKDEDSIEQSYARMAKRILQEHPGASGLSALGEDHNLDELVNGCKRWLDHSRNNTWLLVFDNYDRPKLSGQGDVAAVNIRRFLPEAYHGSIIVTTRSSRVDIGHRLQVGKLENVRDSLQILHDTSRRRDTFNSLDALALAKELDGLPLALATAGAYLDQVSTSFADYLSMYKGSWSRLQQTSPDVSSYDRRLYSTWQLSFDHIKRQNELSAKLLQLWAYFDNQDIWFQLLEEQSSAESEWFSRLTEDELSFNQAMRYYATMGWLKLIRCQKTGSSREGIAYTVAFILGQGWDIEMTDLALKCVGSHVPDSNTKKAWITTGRLVKHVARCRRFLREEVIEEGHEWILHRFGALYSSLGKLTEAESMYQRALKGKEKALGPDHMSTLSTVNNLGNLYKKKGKLKEAESMYQRALDGYEKALGLELVTTYLPALNTAKNFADLYQQMGKETQAKQMYKQAIIGIEAVFGRSSQRYKDCFLALLAFQDNE